MGHSVRPRNGAESFDGEASEKATVGVKSLPAKVVAKHQGISSLGAVMAIGTGMCMLASFTVLPAILHFLNGIGWSMTRGRKRVSG